MRITLLQSAPNSLAYKKPCSKKGTCKADGYWIVSTGPQGKKYGVTLAANAAQPCATAAGRELRLQPRHPYVLHFEHRVLIARLRAQLFDEYIYALRAPRASVEGDAEIPAISGGSACRNLWSGGRLAWCYWARMRGSAHVPLRELALRRRRTASRMTATDASFANCCRAPAFTR